MFPEIEELRRRRKRLGISQKKLAELVGVSQPLIARIESGSFDPKLSLIKKISRVLDEIEGRNIVAKRVMNSPVLSVYANTPLKEAAEMMIEREISQMPVLDEDAEGDRIVGSITENSIVKALVSKSAGDAKVGDVMEDPFPSIDPEESIRSVLSLLLETQAVLVVENGKLVGIITKQDVMKYLF